MYKRANLRIRPFFVCDQCVTSLMDTTDCRKSQIFAWCGRGPLARQFDPIDEVEEDLTPCLGCEFRPAPTKIGGARNEIAIGVRVRDAILDGCKDLGLVGQKLS